MRYHVARNGQVYGPYTLDDLHRYIASGHILPTDSAKSDDMTDWVSVTQILGATSSPVTGEAGPMPGVDATGTPVSPAYAPPGYTAGLGSGMGYGVVQGGLPGPPDLHWGLVLLFDVLTCSLFQLIWNLILAAWFRRIYPPTKVLLLYAAAAVLIFAQGAFGQTMGFMAGRSGLHAHARERNCRVRGGGGAVLGGSPGGALQLPRRSGTALQHDRADRPGDQPGADLLLRRHLSAVGHEPD